MTLIVYDRHKHILYGDRCRTRVDRTQSDVLKLRIPSQPITMTDAVHGTGEHRVLAITGCGIVPITRHHQRLVLENGLAEASRVIREYEGGKRIIRPSRVILVTDQGVFDLDAHGKVSYQPHTAEERFSAWGSGADTFHRFMAMFGLHPAQAFELVGRFEDGVSSHFDMVRIYLRTKRAVYHPHDNLPGATQNWLTILHKSGLKLVKK